MGIFSSYHQTPSSASFLIRLASHPRSELLQSGLTPWLSSREALLPHLLVPSASTGHPFEDGTVTLTMSHPAVASPWAAVPTFPSREASLPSSSRGMATTSRSSTPPCTTHKASATSSPCCPTSLTSTEEVLAFRLLISPRWVSRPDLPSHSWSLTRLDPREPTSSSVPMSTWLRHPVSLPLRTTPVPTLQGPPRREVVPTRLS